MNLPVILAIAGCAALLAGIFGGGVKAKEIVVPKLSTMPRIFSSLAGLVLIGIAIWTSQIPTIEVSPTQIPPTEVPPIQPSPTEIPPTQIPPTEVPKPTATFSEQPPEQSSMVTSAPALTDPNSQAVFVHFVLSKNMVGSVSNIEHALSTNPRALLFVTSNFNPPTSSMIEIYNKHLVAVWYRESQLFNDSRWAIVNQDGGFFPQNAAFNVRILSEGENAFIHNATSENISDNWTVIDHPLASNPNALVFAMPTWGPFGGSANDINHPIGVWYTGSQWAILNLDGTPMREDTAFNVEILSPADNAFVHTSTSSNIEGNSTDIDNHPLVAEDENKLVFVMPRGSPDGSEVNNIQPIGVWYTGSQWAIFNQNNSEPMPVGTAFNILILDEK